MKNRSAVLFMLVVVLSLSFLWGCPKKADVTAVPEAPVAAPKEKPKQEPKAVEEPKAVDERPARVEVGLRPIYFDFDKSFIRDDARSVMRANAEWLKANPKVKIRIEGNCDERGTIEYNQALGQRRAQSAKKYLTDLGISPDRISIISYGKERPICTESNEECWQKNRRADFVALN